MDHLAHSLTIELAQLSIAGVKEDNQDTLGARIPQGSALIHKGIAMAVADGVSSSQAAKHASQAAITGFLNDYYATPDTWRTQTSALRVIQSLNRYLWAQSQNSVRQQGHLTTFSALILKGETAFVFHVGDSRIYHLRDGNLEQVTRDHCQKIDRHTTYLSRALGADPTLEMDSMTLPLEEGDLFLLTTDGVHDWLPGQQLLQLISDADTPLEALPQRIIQAALDRGSQDNLSVQLCRIVKRGQCSQNDAVAALSQLPFPPLLNPGQSLDGLRVKKILHESERSQIYWVEGPNGEQWAMKTPSMNYLDDPAYIERFVMEHWVGSRIQNAHVVRVVEPPRPRTCLYCLTEYIPGPTLAELIRQRAPFAIPDAVELMEQIVRGVRAFHRKDTLHQDLKPGNVLIGSKGAVIIDFGSCWVAGMAELAAPFARDTILGTLDYSAPEYRSGGARSQRSDQFSLGVMLYEMITGRRPYGERYADAMSPKALQKLRYIPASHHNPLVPAWLDRAIEKAVYLHPNGRYEALSEWLTDLRRPNPDWSHPREQPLIERHPLRFWQLMAALGWLVAALSWFVRR